MGKPLLLTGAIRESALSPDSRYAAFIVGDQQTDSRRLVLWKTDQARPKPSVLIKNIKSLEPHFLFSHDSRFISLLDEGIVTTFRNDSGQVNGKPFKHPDASTMAYSTTSALLVTADRSGGIRRWDTRTGKEVGEKLNQAPGKPILTVSPDGRLLAAGQDANAPVRLRFGTLSQVSLADLWLTEAGKTKRVEFIKHSNSLLIWTESEAEKKAQLYVFDVLKALRQSPPRETMAYTRSRICRKSLDPVPVNTSKDRTLFWAPPALCQTKAP